MIGGIYLEFDFDIHRICLVIMCSYKHVYICSMRALLHAYLLGYIFVWASVYMHCFLCART